MIYINEKMDGDKLLVIYKLSTVKRFVEKLNLTEKITLAQKNGNHFFYTVFDLNEYVVYLYIDFLTPDNSEIYLIRYDFDISDFFEKTQETSGFTKEQIEAILKTHRFLNLTAHGEPLGFTKTLIE